MGMDDVNQRLQEFQSALEQFHETLEASIADTRAHHDGVCALWQDAMRREYDARWKPLEEAMQQYVRRLGPSLVETMMEKRRHAERYLGHAD